MELLGIRSLMAKGDCDIKAAPYGIDVDAQSNGYIVTDSFATTRDSVFVTFGGELISGGATFNIYGCSADGEKILYRSDNVAVGQFSLSYTYDPINLAVYRGMESFFAEIELLPFSKLSVRDFSIEASAAAEAVQIERHDFAPKEKKEIPKKMLFMGNSLVFGMKMMYGMCADAPDKDYFHYVTEYVKTKNPDCVFEKLYGSYYEACESLEAFEKWYYEDANHYTHRPSSESFTDDIDIIIIQLGDNINTDAKNDTFKTSGDLFIERVKKASPNARIIWVHGWYNRQPTYDYISSLCERWGIERMDIRDLRCEENEAHTQSEYREADGTYSPIKDTWKTHPGNKGMKKIADRIIEYLGF